MEKTIKNEINNLVKNIFCITTLSMLDEDEDNKTLNKEESKDSISNLLYKIYQIKVNNTDFNIYEYLDNLKKEELFKLLSFNDTSTLHGIMEIICNYLKKTEEVEKENEKHS
ncbi:MAG: hypothetical protein LBH40_03095 [Alphaproteobacteria bacterium]|jgi:hypothetical protein|nr:hypothetical protein [Alphaproteobacteria bacterium]